MNFGLSSPSASTQPAPPSRAIAATAATPAVRPPFGRAAVFLDKDGTLVEDVPYNVDPAQLRFMPGVLAGLQLLARAGLPLIVVSNQPGQALGRFTRAELTHLRIALAMRIRDEAGVDIAGIFVCPHAPGAGSCLCRKPSPGLLRQAAVIHRLDLTRCWMVGDILDDIEAGRRVGCRSVLLDVGNETEWRLSPLRTPHHRCPDLLAAAQIIVAHRPGEQAAPTGTVP